MKSASHALMLGAIALAFAACSGILPAAAPAPKLYTLTAPPEAPGGPAKPGTTQLLVQAPQAPAALDTVRIALSHSPTNVEYYADANWADYAPLMLQALLIESLERGGGFAAVARSSVPLRGDVIVLTELRHFEAQYRGGAGAPQIVIAMDVKLVRVAGGDIAAEKSFTATATAAANNVPAVVDAFDVAGHQVLTDVASWASGALSGRGRNR
jgi:cholesterol transport system auxiliary component